MRSRRRGWIGLLVMIGLVACACGGGLSDDLGAPDPPKTTADSAIQRDPLGSETTTTAFSTGTASGDWPRRADPGEIAVPECARNASCAISFALDDGIVYLVSCSAVRESTVTDEILGRGQLQSQEVRVNRIEGVARSLMVAVSLPGGMCADDDVVRSPWSMAFPEMVDDIALQRASCEVVDLSEDQREANGC